MSAFERVETIRKSKGISRAKLERMSDVASGSIAKWTQFEPKFATLKKVADALEVSVTELMENVPNENVRVPIFGRVAAGVPLEAIQEIIGYEEISEEMNRSGEFFALKIHGDSMYPRILDGDVVIVRKQNTAESGDVVVASVGNEEATCKKYIRNDDGVILLPLNPMYKPLEYSKEEVDNLPIGILGKVVELRGKF